MRNLCVILFVLLATSMVAQKPKWVDNTPQELNHTYKFVEVISYATDIASAREEAKKKLASNEQLLRTVQVNVETGKLREVVQTVTNGKMSETIRDKVDVQMSVSGKKFDLQAYPIDEYVTQEQGMVKMLVDEFAHLPEQDADDFMMSVIPTQASRKTSMLILISTPKGMNQFYKIWQSALAGINTFVPAKIAWNEIDGRDETFRKKVIRDHGIKFFNQEYACLDPNEEITVQDEATGIVLTDKIGKIYELCP